MSRGGKVSADRTIYRGHRSIVLDLGLAGKMKDAWTWPQEAWNHDAPFAKPKEAISSACRGTDLPVLSR
jgi:hypothetical protein